MNTPQSTTIAPSDKIRFAEGNRSPFLTALRTKVQAYLEEGQLSRFGGARILWKALILSCLFLVNYGLILWGGFAGGITLALAILEGLLMTSLLFNIGHDASHGSFSADPRVNRSLSRVWDFCGMSSYVWNLKHNISHHALTNVHEGDVDLGQSELLRMDPFTERKWFHRFQHLYVPFLYGNLGIFALFIRDFQMMKRHRFGNKYIAKHALRDWVGLVIGKLWFLTYAIVIPVLVLPFPLWQVLLGFYLTLFVAGNYAAMVLIPPHATLGTVVLRPSEGGLVEGNWAEQELASTVDFNSESRVTNWLTGGLNHHICHHIFPNLSHVHYPAITRLLKETIREQGLRYRSLGVFAFVANHLAYLRGLGRYD